MLARIVREEFQTGLQAFTAWFKPKERSELPRAEKVAELFGHDLHPVEQAGAATVVADLRECIYHLDAGNSSPAIVPYLNLCRAAKKSLTVMIEGQGADELFFGYSYMFPFAAFGFIRNLQFGQALQTVWGQVRSDGLLRAAQEYARFASRGVYGNQYMQWDRGFLDRRVTSAASFPQSPRLSLTRHGELNASIQRHRNGLSNLPQYGDAISMAASLETRCPFLDFRLVEYGFQLPLDLLVRRGQGKFLLRHSVEGNLPHDVVWPRRKDGFANDTTPALRTAMRDGRIPNDAIDLSIELGLFTPKIKNIDAMMKVKDSPFFRILSTILWVDAFYGPRRVR
jgi:asparagine synthase (glutamine-hydrolysing)